MLLMYVRDGAERPSVVGLARRVSRRDPVGIVRVYCRPFAYMLLMRNPVTEAAGS